MSLLHIEIRRETQKQNKSTFICYENPMKIHDPTDISIDLHPYEEGRAFMSKLFIDT